MNTEMGNGIQMTLEMWMPEACPRQTVGALEHHVRTFLSQENGQDWTETDQALYAKFLDSWKNKKSKTGLNGLSMKMLRECFLATEDSTICQSSLKWTDLGTISNGRISTQNGSFPKTGSAYTLSDILEDTVDEKYFLSREQMENTQTFSSDGITEALDTGQGGGRGHHVAIPCFCDMNYGSGIKFTENSRTLQARYGKGISNRCGETSGVAIKIIGEVNSSQDGKVHDISGISRCHSAGHNNSPKVAIPINVKCININDKNGKERSQQDRVYAIDGDMTALNSSLGGRHNIAIPVLTPDRTNKRQNGRSFKENGDPMFTLTAQDRHGVGVEVLGGLYTNPSPNYNRGILDGISRTLKADSHPAGVGLGIIYPQGRNRKEVSLKDICPTLRSETHGNVPDVCIDVTGNMSKQSDGIYVEMPDGFVVYAIWYEKEQCYIVIRRLTPKECFRLQGWTDDYFEKAAFVNSDSRLYMQAGNGVTVDVTYAIGKKIAECEKESLKEFQKHMNKPKKGEE